MKSDTASFEIFNRVIVEGKFALQHTIRDTLSLLEESDDLVHNLDKRHTCGSPAGTIGESGGAERRKEKTSQ